MIRITLSSLPGAGSSTLARGLASKLKIKRVDAGEIWDGMARERNTDVLGLNLIAEKDKSIDLGLDKKMLELAKESKGILLEGRIIGWLCHKNKIPAFKIWLRCPLEIRASRIAGREKKDYDQILKETKAREQSEAKRYKELYNIDINDFSIYDLVVDSARTKPDEIVRYILNKLGW